MTRFPAALLAAIALAAVCFFCIGADAPLIEADVAERSSEALTAGAISYASVFPDGRHITLHGTAPDEEARLRAEEVVLGVWGVAGVDNQMVVDGGGASPAAEEAAAAANECQVGFDRVLGSAQIQFESSSSVLTDSSHDVLDELVMVAGACPDARIQVSGHTDSSGNPALNARLSEERAVAVVEYLVANGMDGSRLSSTGFGASRPIASNETEAGKAQNRRIALNVQGL